MTSNSASQFLSGQLADASSKLLLAYTNLMKLAVDIQPLLVTLEIGHNEALLTPFSEFLFLCRSAVIASKICSSEPH